MKKIFMLTALFISLSAQARYETPLEMANWFKQLTKDAVGLCHVNFYDPYDNRLPRPRVRADYAMAKKLTYDRLGLVGYYREDYEIGRYPNTPVITYRYMQSNGGDLASIRIAGENEVQFVTARRGVVARATRYRSTDGNEYRMYCNNMVYRFKDHFHRCVVDQFSRAVTNEICRR